MPSPSKPPPIAEALRGSLAYAARAKDHLRAGLSDARIASLTPPPADEHARRFFFGFALPLTLMRIAWSNAETRSSIRRRLIPPLLFVGLVAGVGVVQIVQSVVTNHTHPTTLALQIDDGKDDDDDDTKKTNPREAKDEQAVRASEQAVANAAKEARDKGGSLHEISAAALAAARTQAAAFETREHTELAAAKADADLEKTKVASATLAAPAGALRIVWSFLTSKVAKLIAALSVIEWILVWIGREHHDQIAYETSVLSGVPGEALAGPPRLRFDAGWLKLKLWRALRLAFFFSLALPIAWLAGRIPYVGEWLAVAIEGAWAMYWACVFAIGNTFLAWEAPVGERAPWFVRALHRVGRVPVVGLPARLYARLVVRVTRNVWPACLAFEETAWESAGMALARTIASVPVMYIVTRPVFAPAATHVFLARVPDAPRSEVPER